MSRLHRACGRLAILAGAILLLGGGQEFPPSGVLCAQKAVPFDPGVVALPGDAASAPKSDAFQLPADRPARQKLEAAEDYIKDQSWTEAARLLQAVLDLREDSFFLREADPKNRVPARWTSARAEAERLLASMPPDGLAFYQLTYDAPAAKMLKDAVRLRDPLPLAEVVRRYQYTRPGAEALELLGTYYLDRGQADLAALAFRRRLERGPAEKVAPLTLFKAALAFASAGDRAREQDAWDRLAKQLGPGGLRLGGRAFTFEQLRDGARHWAVAPPPAGDSPLFRGDAVRSARAAGEIPYLDARARIATAETEAGRSWIASAYHSAPATAVPLPGGVPIALGDRLIYRSQGGVHALDARSGKELWRAPSPLSLDGSLRDPGKKVQLDHWLNLYRNARSLLVENSVLGTLSSDGRRVFAVEDLAVPPCPDIVSLQQQGLPRFYGPFTDAVYHNRLRALDADSGAVEWEVGGRGPKAPPELADAYFLGPPLPLGQSLFAVVEQKQEVRLVCLRADSGAVLWSQPLGTARDKLLLNVLTRVQAVHPAYADGVLVCPTGAGAVVGVDPLGRGLLWAHVYRDRPPPVPTGVAADFPPAEFNTEAIHSSWKAATPILHDGRVVFTAPDGDSVRCLDLRTGALLWKVGRTEEDLYVGAVSGGKVLLVGKNACRALNLADGETVWQQRTGRPSGLGVLAGKTYFLPLHRAVVALDLDSPRDSARIDASGGQVVGNLLFHNGELWSQTSTELAAYPPLARHFERVERRVHDNAADPAARLERGRLRMSRGDLAGAVVDFREALENEPAAELREQTRRQLFEALTRLLRRDLNAGEKYLAEYRELCRTAIPATAGPEERARLQAEQQRNLTRLCTLVAAGREGQGRLPDAVRAYRELYDRAGGELMDVPDDPGVRVRPDLWVRMQVAALVERAKPEQRTQLQADLQREWKTLSAGDDADALARFAALFEGIPGPPGAPAREARLRLAELEIDGGNRRRAAATELALLALERQADSPNFAARVRYARARLLTRHGLLDDALACYRTLAGEYPKETVHAGRTGPDLLRELTGDKRFLGPLHPPRPAWAAEKLKIRTQEVQGGITAQGMWIPGGAVGEPDPSAARLRFQIDPQSGRLRALDRDTSSELWSVQAPPVMFNQFVSYGGEFLRYRVVGHVALFNLGPYLLGVDLLERRVRWTYNLVDEPLGLNRGIVFNPDGSFQVFSQEGRVLYKLGVAGPVTPAGLTVQTRTGLLALDPIDGRTRWVRADLAPQFDVFGDEQRLYLAEYQADGAPRAVRAVRAADGVAVAVPDAVDSYAHRAKTFGRRLLVSEEGRGETLNLRLYDVHAGKDVWSMTFPRESVVLESPVPDLLGVATPKDGVSVFQLSTGRLLHRLAVNPAHMAKVTRGQLLRDPTQLYVALVGPNDPDARLLEGAQPPSFGDLKGVPVNGMVYAFRRDSDELNWHQRVPHQTLILDRFEELPLLLFTTVQIREIGPVGGGNNAAFLCTRSIDKATGKIRCNREAQNNGEPFHTLHVNAQTGVIELIGTSTRLRHVVERAP